MAMELAEWPEVGAPITTQRLLFLVREHSVEMTLLAFTQIWTKVSETRMLRS
jgi:hypothetical protein